MNSIMRMRVPWGWKRCEVEALRRRSYIEGSGEAIRGGKGLITWFKMLIFPHL